MDENYIIEALERTGRRQVELAKHLGLDPTIVNKIVRGRRKISAQEADKIRIFFNDPLTTLSPKSHTIQLLGDVSQAIPLIGNVQAGSFIEAFEEEPTEYIPIIAPLDNFRDSFALRVIGDSMNLVYPEGTVLICQRLDDYQPDLKNGKRVIVKRRGRGDYFEATVKEYAADGRDTVLTPLSSNPKYKSIRFSNGNSQLDDAGAPEVQVWAVVLASITLEF